MNEESRKWTVSDVRRMVLESMTDDDRATRVFYIDEVVRPAGSELKIGQNSYSLGSETIVVFVDDEPGVNWGHPCHYLLFDTHTGEMRRIPERYPPSLTDVPGSFRLIWKPAELPDWGLWSDQ